MTGPAPKVIRQDILNNGVLTGLLGFATVALVTAVLNIDLVLATQ